MTETKNESIYKLSDEYSIFYLKFIEHAKDMGSGSWLRQYNTAAYTIWSGFAFETVCLKHVLQIRRALGIEGVLTNASPWRHKPGKGKQGAQFIIDKKYAPDLNNKINMFHNETKTKSIHTVFLFIFSVLQSYSGLYPKTLKMPQPVSCNYATYRCYLTTISSVCLNYRPPSIVFRISF